MENVDNHNGNQTRKKKKGGIKASIDGMAAGKKHFQGPVRDTNLKEAQST